MIKQVCDKLLSILATDPDIEVWNGKEYPKEHLYTIRLVNWISKINPNPSDELLIAAHGQHIYRWLIPRHEFPMDRNGYLLWRRKLAIMHADETGKILEVFGYSKEFISRVKQIIRKENLSTDNEVICLEDAINLSFVEFYMQPFSLRYEHKKLLDITIKVLRKMSPKAHKTALTIEMPDVQRNIIIEAASLLQ